MDSSLSRRRAQSLDDDCRHPYARACYDFVYVASQLYIDKNVAIPFRAQAQGFFVLVSYGVGQGLGTLVAGFIFNSIMSGNDASASQWQTFWLIPLLFAVVVTIMFVWGFTEYVADKNRIKRPE
jgi:MFS family permease